MDKFPPIVNMKQKYLFLITGAALIFILIILLFITAYQKNKNNQAKSPVSPSPVTFDNNRSFTKTNDNLNEKISKESSYKNTPSPQKNKEINPVNELLTIIYPFYQNYSSPSPTIILSQRVSKISSPTITPDPRIILRELFGVVFGQMSGSLQQSSFYPENTSIPSKSSDSTLQSQNQTSTIKSLPSNLTYYSQCHDLYDQYPLPNGCNICQAGCGPTSVAMILSSYVDKKFTPSYVADLYKQNNFEAGCKGTKIGDAQTILEQNGLKTTDLLYYGETPTNEVIEDMKSYLKYGWTIFMLAKFCQKGCGHFFWIVDIDQNNNVWAYDPGYGNIDGKKIVPINENSLNPSPKYYAAFGVKK